MNEKYMKLALELAYKGKCSTAPNPMVGAVIVKDNKIIGQGYHEFCGGNHAEINAIESATESLEGTTIYVTLEPCSHHGKTPPCADRLVKEKFSKVVIATLDPNPLVAGRGVAILKEAGIEVVTGVMEEESIIMNEVFMKYITKKVPFVLMKAAMSMDGKIATFTGESKWISSEESRREVQEIRNYFTGIMVGIGTVLADDPELTCRIPGGKNPVRIIVDSNLKIPLESKVLQCQNQAKTIIATTVSDKDRINEIESFGAEVISVPGKDGRVDLKFLMKELGKRQIDSILLEGGGTLNFSAIEDGIIDKVIFYMAPIIIGGSSAKSPVGGNGFEHLKDALKLDRLNVSSIGKDIRIEGYPERR